MSKSNLIKGFILIIALSSATGCAKIFKKPGDEPVKSPCEACKKKPFYVNGKRI